MPETKQEIRDVLLETDHKDLFVYLARINRLDFIFTLWYFNNKFDIIFLN